ncbi:MAG: hypothetical protein V4805_12665 [Pseudomonadota bacterium]
MLPVLFLLAATAFPSVAMGHKFQTLPNRNAALAAKVHDFIENLEHGYQIDMSKYDAASLTDKKWALSHNRAFCSKWEKVKPSK